METEATFSLAITRVTDDVRRALARMAAEEAPDAELHNAGAYLVNLLELVAPDPGIEAASDDLYNAAAMLVGAEDLSDQAERESAMHEAYGPSRPRCRAPGRVTRPGTWA